MAITVNCKEATPTSSERWNVSIYQARLSRGKGMLGLAAFGEIQSLPVVAGLFGVRRRVEDLVLRWKREELQESAFCLMRGGFFTA